MLSDIVRIEHRNLRGSLKTLRTQCIDVGVSPDEYSKVSIETLDLPNRLGIVIVQVKTTITLPYDPWNREKLLQFLSHADWS